MKFSKQFFQQNKIEKFFPYNPKCLVGNQILDLDSYMDNGRFYITPEGNHWPSITTILGATGDKEFLEEWKSRIGEKEANRITRLAGSRGSGLHDITEKYIRGNSTYLDDVMPLPRKLFHQIKPFLDNSLGEVFGIEQALYSNVHKIAGRSDLIGLYNDKVSIIDYKSSINPKQLDWIQDYFIQGAGYGTMFNLMSCIHVEQIVILIGVENSQKGQEFIVPFLPYQPPFVERIIQYYNSH